MDEQKFNEEFERNRLRYEALKEQVGNEIEVYTHLVETEGPNIETQYMMETLVFAVFFAVIIIWVLWRFFSTKIPYWVEQIIQYSWLLVNAVLLLFTHEYWNIFCCLIVIFTVLFSLGINTETGMLLLNPRNYTEGSLDRLDERRFYLKVIDDILMDVNIVVLAIHIVLIVLHIVG